MRAREIFVRNLMLVGSRRQLSLGEIIQVIDLVGSTVGPVLLPLRKTFVNYRYLLDSDRWQSIHWRVDAPLRLASSSLQR